MATCVLCVSRIVYLLSLWPYTAKDYHNIKDNCITSVICFNSLGDTVDCQYIAHFWENCYTVKIVNNSLLML